ncbi:unnamed protein product [Symbiodinium sp. CCMP2592]|nr:unnamed protein product [Symbiodinium sp. CCMP2592]
MLGHAPLPVWSGHASARLESIETPSLQLPISANKLSRQFFGDTARQAVMQDGPTGPLLCAVPPRGTCGVGAAGHGFVCHIAEIAATSNKSEIDLDALSDLYSCPFIFCLSDVDLFSHGLKASQQQLRTAWGIAGIWACAVVNSE